MKDHDFLADDLRGAAWPVLLRERVPGEYGQLLTDPAE
jgi:hypothetical protein